MHRTPICERSKDPIEFIAMPEFYLKQLDFKNNLKKTAPQNLDYQHDDLKKRTVNLCPDECINGHSHCKAIHLLVNTTLNLIEGEIQLGLWQRILFVELDKPRKRKVQIQILGN